jgi:hypothetical protein
MSANCQQANVPSPHRPLVSSTVLCDRASRMKLWGDPETRTDLRNMGGMGPACDGRCRTSAPMCTTDILRMQQAPKPEMSTVICAHCSPASEEAPINSPAPELGQQAPLEATADRQIHGLNQHARANLQPPSCRPTRCAKRDNILYRIGNTAQTARQHQDNNIGLVVAFDHQCRNQST